MSQYQTYIISWVECHTWGQMEMERNMKFFSLCHSDYYYIHSEKLVFLFNFSLTRDQTVFVVTKVFSDVIAINGLDKQKSWLFIHWILLLQFSTVFACACVRKWNDPLWVHIKIYCLYKFVRTFSVRGNFRFYFANICISNRFFPFQLKR